MVVREHTEVEQLGRGGAARHTGPRKAGIMFGVLKQLEEKPSDAATPDNVFRLGKKLAAHCLRDDTLEVLGKILEACEDAEVKEQWPRTLLRASLAEFLELCRARTRSTPTRSCTSLARSSWRESRAATPSPGSIGQV